MRSKFVLSLAAALLAGLSLPAAAEAAKADPAKPDSGGDMARQHQKDKDAEAVEGWIKPPVEERAVVTHHVAETRGGRIAYAATAGTLTIRDDEAKPIASIFYVAYTADKPGDYRKRPITFFYNGGPGSSSLWLHMGSFGPMRVATANPEFVRPAPFNFGPNPDTLLDKTDMVFLDMVGAGFSRPLGDKKGKDFWGVDQDVDAFARGIIRYVTKTARWQSPKVIFGESYGTTRSGALAYALQDRGMALNGVVLLSSILNYGIRQPGYDRLYITYLPSYAATAWYHHKLANPPATVEEAVARARQFADGPYAAALAQGSALDPASRQRIAEQMAALTGLSPAFILNANLRVDLPRFQKELLRDQRLTIGRFDSRYTGVDADAAGDAPEFDASSEAISGAYIGAFSDYLVRDLHYDTEMPYRVSAYNLDGFSWDWKHAAPVRGYDAKQSVPNTAVDLAVAMRTNPYLHVLSLNGYYDMATPFAGTEYDLRHMQLGPDQARNFAFHYYPAGHMAYLNPDARAAMHRDLAAFFDDAVADAQQRQPSAPPSLSAGRVGGGQ
ncbi:S10 family peptidase [Sphingomonas morindae]|uniref:Peptidase S10 n=1 Tax=Sphingomonas morindae TaxID=1541170 RepID=A0ABY4XA86_9SPHN|nr:peptidase S10 [Sphingomonas morindae]USI73785.1 peptidase S10 [Sphingomonas morindae]